MKTHIFNRTAAFPNKVNFVDSNNVILGYDLEEQCCEHAFWSISENADGSSPIHKGDNEETQEIELKNYVFNQEFCERICDENNDVYVAVFKLQDWKVWKFKPDLYIRLENHHNGYYCHGFTFRGAVIIEDVL